MTKLFKLPLVEGATNEFEITLFDPDAPTQPLNLTGSSFRLRIRPDPCSEVILMDLPSVNGTITLTPLLGKALFTFLPIATCGALWSSAVYTVEMTDSLDRITRVLAGAVSIEPGGICV